MKKINTSAFTFVELIVVMTILAILSTIGFGVYQSYLSGGRDTNRLIQLKDIHDGLETYSINSRLPFPEDMIEIQANGNTFAYQGYVGDGVIKAIGYDGGGRDIEYGNYLTYMLGDNQRDFQLMTYIDDPELLSQNLVNHTYANQDYTTMFPKILGVPLGILVDYDLNVPIQELENIAQQGYYDVVSGTGIIKAYYGDTRFIRSDIEGLIEMIGNRNCKRILDIGHSKGNGTYIISLDGITRIPVYCDMEIDEGGWMMVARSVEGTSYTGNFGWLYSTGSPDNDRQPYSFGSNIKSINFTEMLFGVYGNGKNIIPYIPEEHAYTYGTRTAVDNSVRHVAVKATVLDLSLLISESTEPNTNLHDTKTYDQSSSFLCYYGCGGGGQGKIWWGNYQNIGNYNITNQDNGSSQGLTASKFNNSIFNNSPGIIFVR